MKKEIVTGMTTGEFPPESKFGTLEYWRDRAKKLEAKCRTVEEELAILKAKLSEMIIVGGTCLACSPDVRTAYHEREIEKDEFYRTFTEISAINDALVELSNKKGVEHKQQIATLKAENERLTESRNNCQREYLLMRDTARQFETALTASWEEVGNLKNALRDIQKFIPIHHGEEDHRFVSIYRIAQQTIAGKETT
jgi:hypothetical protein